MLLAAVAFGDVGTYGLARPTHLIGQHTLLDRWKRQAGPMNLERRAIGTLEDLKVLKRHHFSSALTVHPSFVVCQLFSESLSFGVWLEPRYIFGAKTLI